LNKPGRNPFSTSATTVTVIFVGVTPTSGLVSVTFLHASALAPATVVVAPRSPPPPLSEPPLLPHALNAMTAVMSASAITPKRTLICPPEVDHLAEVPGQ
jgi:hypothetical protein